MNKKKGYFRKGWFTYSVIRIFSTIGALGSIYIGYNQGGISGFLVSIFGFLSFAIGGALFSAIICDDYLNSGEQKL